MGIGSLIDGEIFAAIGLLLGSARLIVNVESFNDIRLPREDKHADTREY